MAIKVKHEGNVTSRILASGLGGRARRNAEDSKALAQMAAQQNMAANRQLQGSHASPVSPGHATAQLGHASAPPMGAQHPPTDPERMAAVQQRVGDVKNAQHREILDYQHNLAKDRAEQSSLLTTERDIKSALLKVPPKGTPPAVLAPFATDPNASGDQPELFNRLKEINPKLLNLRDGLNGEEQQKPFDNAMAMALKVISGAGTSMDADPMSPGAPSGSGKLGMMFDSLSAQRGRGAPAAQPTSADDISGVYESGGSIFGGQGDAPTPSPSVSWLRSPDAEIAAGGGDAVASEAYASSVGGMIDAFMRRNYNV